jgi:hypothetical protein
LTELVDCCNIDGCSDTGVRLLMGTGINEGCVMVSWVYRYSRGCKVDTATRQSSFKEESRGKSESTFLILSLQNDELYID